MSVSYCRTPETTVGTGEEREILLIWASKRELVLSHGSLRVEILFNKNLVNHNHTTASLIYKIMEKVLRPADPRGVTSKVYNAIPLK